MPVPQQFLMVVAAVCVLTGVGEPARAQGDAPAAPTQAARADADDSTDELIFTRFLAWTQQYVEAQPGPAKNALETEGKTLARQRRRVLARLIASDPKRALELALPAPFRQPLPALVRRELETPVRGRGDLAVLAIDTFDTQTGQRTTRSERTATINNITYQASVYGRRAGMATKQNIPLHGIALNGVLAVHESPLRLLDPSETPAPAPSQRCAVCGNPSPQPIAADAGGSFVFFDSDAHLEAYTRRLVKQEDVVGPNP